MFSENILQKYAKLAVVMGVNVQKGQTLVINSPVHASEFVEYIVREAYEVGAKEVIVNFTNEIIAKMHYEYQDVETLCTVPQYLVDSKTIPMKNGGCVLHIDSAIPEIMKGISPEKMQKSSMARQKKFKELNELTMSGKVQWSIVGYPNLAWAKKVFPNVSDEEAVKLLSKAILDSVQVLEDNDPIEAWEKHNSALSKHEKVLNDYNFKSLRFKNTAGTDLEIELVKDHIWAAGSESTPGGIVFNPNMPTEEVFTMPYKYGVNGKVVSTKPLSYQGNLIEKFSLDFKDGKVVSYSAEKNEDTLKTLIEFDEGSCYIGEVALVPYHSPISMSDILFYDTLYDENASCHLALGRAYPMNVKGGVDMTQEELNNLGSNDSMTHVDFMFGSSDMKITGITLEGKEVSVFQDGDFVF